MATKAAEEEKGLEELSSLLVVLGCSGETLSRSPPDLL